MNITLTTPAVLFPAISLLLLAYTNRFVALATIIRNFDQSQEGDEGTQQQISNLRERIQLIKRMQEAGLDYDLRCRVMGHANSRPKYGDGGSLSWRRDQLSKITLPFDSNALPN